MNASITDLVSLFGAAFGEILCIPLDQDSVILGFGLIVLVALLLLEQENHFLIRWLLNGDFLKEGGWICQKGEFQLRGRTVTRLQTC